MSALKSDKYRFWLTYLLKDLPEGSVFTPEDLHITIIPWFVVDSEVEESLADSFKDKFLGFQSFGVEVGKEVSLGPRNDISVFLIEGGRQIFDLHSAALEWMGSLNGRWAVKNPYVGDEYKPHIRRRPNTTLRIGDNFRVDSLTMVKALRRADETRVVEAKVLFDE